jgi:hypothetical protein
MPLIFLRHFSGYMDSCDRAVVNALAGCHGEREQAILQGFDVWRAVLVARGDRIAVDLGARRIAFLGQSADHAPIRPFCW